MKKYPIETKSIEELVAEANRYLELSKYEPELTEVEEIEEDAEYGYFQGEDA